MIRAQLLSQPAVLFAGYKVPHPLEPYFVIKVQTDGSITPNAAIQQACQELIKTLNILQERFKSEFAFKEMEIVGDDPYAVPGVTFPGQSSGWGMAQTDYSEF